MRSETVPQNIVRPRRGFGVFGQLVTIQATLNSMNLNPVHRVTVRDSGTGVVITLHATDSELAVLYPTIQAALANVQ